MGALGYRHQGKHIEPRVADLALYRLRTATASNSIA